MNYKMSSLKLTSFTPLGPEIQKKVITIWKTIYDSNDSLEFRNPVDWRAMGLLDYPKYVQKPMDLNTISRKLRQDKYRAVQNVLDDIQLIFDNCKVYNAPGSWIYNLADKLEKSFIKMICNFIPKIVDANIKSKINSNYSKIKQPQVADEPMQQQPAFFIQEVCYNDKIKFTDKLTHINSQNLEAIVNKILQKNADAVKILPKEEDSKVQIPIISQIELKPEKQILCSLQDVNKVQELKPQLQQQPKPQPQQQNLNPQNLTQVKPQQTVNQPIIQQNNNMQIQQVPKGRGRRKCSSRNLRNQKKQTSKATQQKITVGKWQIGTKAQIFIDDLNYESFEQLMKLLEGMVQEKDKVMKKIKLD